MLGELRGDLVKPDPEYGYSMGGAWFDLANFENLEDTAFNRYRDYYTVVNNCNFYLDRADAEMERSGQKVFLKELCGSECIPCLGLFAVGLALWRSALLHEAFVVLFRHRGGDGR